MNACSSLAVRDDSFYGSFIEVKFDCSRGRLRSNQLCCMNLLAARIRSLLSECEHRHGS
jgi:hypothetical protein